MHFEDVTIFATDSPLDCEYEYIYQTDINEAEYKSCIKEKEFIILAFIN